MSIKPSFSKQFVADSPFHLSLDLLYKNRLNALIAFASKHVYRKDMAIDMVHDAIAKSTEYFNKHPGKKVSERIVQCLILRACRKYNKFSVEVESGLMNYD